jgi:lipopolysaccharide export system permease protein
MAYLALLIAARGSLDKGRIPPALGLWWVHGIFFAIGMLMLYWEPLRLAISKRRSLSRAAHA